MIGNWAFVAMSTDAIVEIHGYPNIANPAAWGIEAINDSWSSVLLLLPCNTRLRAQALLFDNPWSCVMARFFFAIPPQQLP